MNGDFLALFATDRSGDVAWDRSRAIFGPEFRARTNAELVTGWTSAEMLGDSAPTAPPPVLTLIERIREKLPRRALTSLEVALATGIDTPADVTCTLVLLDAFADVWQIATLIHLFLRVPADPHRFSTCVPQIEVLLAAPQWNRVHLAEICWLRVPASDPAASSDITFADTQIRAAHHALWSHVPMARRPVAILTPCPQPQRMRHSVSGRLQFERAQWLSYARSHLTVKLTHFVETPPRPETRAGAVAWVSNVRLPSRSLPLPARDSPRVPLRRPADPLRSPSGRELAPAFDKLAEQAREVVRLQTRGIEPQWERVERGVCRALDDEAASASDALRGLCRARDWGEAAIEALNSPASQAELQYGVLLPRWLRHCNKRLRILRWRHPGLRAKPFDLTQPSAWTQQAADLATRLLSLTSGGPVSRDYCLAAWMTQIVPRLVERRRPASEVWEGLCAPVMEVVRQLERQMEDCRKATATDTADILAAHPVPTGRIARWRHALFTQPRVRHQIAGRRRAGKRTIRRLWGRAKRLLREYRRWLPLACHYDLVTSARNRETAILRSALEPIQELFNDFVTRRRAVHDDLDRFPEGPTVTSDTLGLLAKEHLGLLARQLRPDEAGWIRSADETSRPLAGRAWLNTARQCRATLDVWAAGRAAEFRVDLADLLCNQFPQLAEPRLIRLRDLVGYGLLPLRPRNSSQRRLVHEWHLPDDRGLAELPALTQAVYANQTLSLEPTECHRFVLDDPDRLELHLHLLGFDPEDAQHWKLFP